MYQLLSINYELKLPTEVMPGLLVIQIQIQAVCACSQNSQTKLIVWSFCAQSTVPPLHSSMKTRRIFVLQFSTEKRIRMWVLSVLKEGFKINKSKKCFSISFFGNIFVYFNNFVLEGTRNIYENLVFPYKVTG